MTESSSDCAMWMLPSVSVTLHSFRYPQHITAVTIMRQESLSKHSPVFYRTPNTASSLPYSSPLSSSPSMPSPFLAGLRMIGGANDGSIHIWQERKVYSKPDLLIRLAHPVGSLVTSVLTSSTGLVPCNTGSVLLTPCYLHFESLDRNSGSHFATTY